MVRVIAHRGARSLAPENTLTAAKKAWYLGADLWETDVQLTCDGALVLFHDKTLLRCTDAAAKFPDRACDDLAAFSLAELNRLDAGSYFVRTDPFGQIAEGQLSAADLAECEKAVIPTLEQALAFTQNAGWKVNLELKSFQKADQTTELPRKTLDVICQSGISPDKVVISSFHHSFLRYIAQAAPQIEVQALVDRAEHACFSGRNLEFATYNVHADLVNGALVGQLKSMGRKINVFTVNDRQHFFCLEKMGVDGIFTDFVQWFCSGHVHGGSKKNLQQEN